MAESANITHNQQAEHSQPKERSLHTLKELVGALSVALEILSLPELPDLDQPADFYEEVRRFEISLLQRALKKTRGNQAKAARLLGLNQPTLHAKIKQYRIHPEIISYREEATESNHEEEPRSFGGDLRLNVCSGDRSSSATGR